MLGFSARLGLLVWSAGMWKSSAFWSLVQISKRLLCAACYKIRALENVLITLFFPYDFLLCSYLVLTIQVTGRDLCSYESHGMLGLEGMFHTASHPGYADGRVLSAGGHPGTLSICCALLQ